MWDHGLQCSLLTAGSHEIDVLLSVFFWNMINKLHSVNQPNQSVAFTLIWFVNWNCVSMCVETCRGMPSYLHKVCLLKWRFTLWFCLLHRVCCAVFRPFRINTKSHILPAYLDLHDHVTLSQLFYSPSSEFIVWIDAHRHRHTHKANYRRLTCNTEQSILSALSV